MARMKTFFIQRNGDGSRHSEEENGPDYGDETMPGGGDANGVVQPSFVYTTGMGRMQVGCFGG